MKKVLAAWGTWLAWIGITFAFAQWIPYILGEILLIGVPVLFCVLILLGQQSLPLWANIPLLILQVAVASPATMYMALIQAAKDPTDHPYVCYNFSLESEIPGRTISGVEAHWVSSDACPLPMASELEFAREYGVIRIRKHVSYLADGPPWDSVEMAAQSIDGRRLRISGPRVNENDYRKPVLLDQPAVTVGFGRAGEPQTFTVEISRESGEPIDHLEFRYARHECTCVSSGI